MSEKCIEATVKYEACSEPVVHFVFDGNQGESVQVPHTVRIADARSVELAPSLKKEGFDIFENPIGGIDFSDSSEVQSKWQRSAERLLVEVTGAPEAIAWSSGVRYSEHAEAPPSNARGPARRVHADHGQHFDPNKFFEPEYSTLLRAAKERMGIDRVSSWCCFNVWQPITDPPEDAPLALCDASSVAEGDIVVALGRLSKHKDIEVEISLFRANPAHRWFYFSGMRPSEALIFTGVDPAVAGAHRTVPHTAFDDPTWPGNVPPRGSVEARAMVIYG